MNAAKDQFADYQALWGGTREYIDFKWAFPKEFEDEPPRGADEWRAVEQWEVASPEERADWPDRVRRRWEQYHLRKAESLGFKITIGELIWETSGMFTEGRGNRWLEMMRNDPGLPVEEARRRLLLEHLKEVAQQPDYFNDSGEEKYERILGEMGIRRIE